jgi:DNA (cytosine-5)-methyltransferase 1
MLLQKASSKQIRLTPDLKNKCIERYEVEGDQVVRKIILPDGLEVTSQITIDQKAVQDCDAQSVFDHSFLRLKTKSKINFSEEITSVDLFSGCGCLSLGALEACTAIGKKLTPLLAIDRDPDALSVYSDNFNPSKTYSKDISTLVDGAMSSKLTASELQLRNNYLSGIAPILLLAGPPCQGYSSLNNYHRQKDDRNKLYERVARFVEITSPANVLIENVPTVIYSTDKVVDKTIQLMKSKGYFVDSGIVNLVDIGVPQLRKRHVVVASKTKKVLIAEVIASRKVNCRRTFDWAAGDLQDEPAISIFNTPTKHSEENRKRMAYLYDNKLYDLPDRERPKCHRKKHGYKSMYGRIKADEPTQTITSGFTSPGQGRYIHPSKLRTITPHEAARLQLIPDYFDFSHATTRRSLSRMIGNAAPMKLSYVFCLELLT